ncbi:MAG: hypothetical protein WCX24_00605 [Candidatus Paceibacterota bacterium]
MKLSGKNLNQWMSAEEIKKETGCDIEPLIIGLSESVAKSPNKGYVVYLKDLAEYLATVGRVAASLSGTPSEEKKPKKQSSRFPTDWLTGREVAKRLNRPLEDVVGVIASQELSAKRVGRGWLINPEELEKISQLLNPPEPQGGDGVVPDISFSSDPEVQGKPADSEPPKEGEKDPDQNKDEEKGPPSAPPDRTGQESGIIRTVSVRVRGEKGCLPSDIAQDLKLPLSTVKIWIDNEAVKLMPDGEYMDLESLKEFLVRQGRATTVNVIKYRGAPQMLENR